MRPVLCFGEALIDFLNTGNDPDGPLSLPTFRQYPGGAPANASVAVAKLGGTSRFVGQVGDDAFGHFILSALKRYGVDTELVSLHPTAKTALAFVMLDEEGDRSFSFHRYQTADVVFAENQLQQGWFNEETIFHFCSNTLTDNDIATVTQRAVNIARDMGATISFDVNLRHNLWPDNRVDHDVVNRCVHSADILKFASEELDYLAQGNSEAYLQTCLDQGVQLILITDGPNHVRFITANIDDSIASPKVDAVDTTAAGDAFSGAVLYGVSRASNLKAIINDADHIHALLNFAVHCSALTVTKPGAFPALPSFDEVKTHWKDMP